MVTGLLVLYHGQWLFKPVLGINYIYNVNILCKKALYSVQLFRTHPVYHA